MSEQALYHCLSFDEWLKVTAALSYSEIKVLYYILCQNPMGDREIDCRVKTIAKVMSISVGAVSSAITHLVAKGFIGAVEAAKTKATVKPHLMSVQAQTALAKQRSKKKTEVQSTETEVQSTETEVQSTETEVQSTETEVQSTETEVQSTETEVQSTETEVIYRSRACDQTELDLIEDSLSNSSIQTANEERQESGEIQLQVPEPPDNFSPSLLNSTNSLAQPKNSQEDHLPGRPAQSLSNDIVIEGTNEEQQRQRETLGDSPSVSVDDGNSSSANDSSSDVTTPITGEDNRVSGGGVIRIGDRRVEEERLDVFDSTIQVASNDTATDCNKTGGVIIEDSKAINKPVKNLTEVTDTFGKRQPNIFTGKIPSCASDPWMDGQNPKKEFKEWVFEKHRKEGSSLASLANASSEIRKDYLRAGDLWEEYQISLVSKNQLTTISTIAVETAEEWQDRHKQKKSNTQSVEQGGGVASILERVKLKIAAETTTPPRRPVSTIKCPNYEEVMKKVAEERRIANSAKSTTPTPEVNHG